MDASNVNSLKDKLQALKKKSNYGGEGEQVDGQVRYKKIRYRYFGVILWRLKYNFTNVNLGFKPTV